MAAVVVLNAGWAEEWGCQRLGHHTARGAHENRFPRGLGVNHGPQTRCQVILFSPGRNALFESNSYQMLGTPLPNLWCLPLVHHRHGLAECFDLLKIILVRWISENGLGTMVPIQKLESHSSCSGGESHTKTLNRKSGNRGSGSSSATWVAAGWLWVHLLPFRVSSTVPRLDDLSGLI